MTPAGFPHSDIPGSKRACRSPRLFAACYVLLRLSVPRHPPSTLSNLTIKCLDLMRSAVESLTDSSCISFYNPYSIVNEHFTVAKTNAGFDSLRSDPPLVSRLAALSRCGSCTTPYPMAIFRTPRGLISGRRITRAGIGGADRDRTDDPLLAKQVLSQLSYSPIGSARIED